MTAAADTDITVRDARVSFREIDLDHPFMISGRAITWFTLALVDVVATNRRGEAATGRGASVLSVPWSWPTSRLDVRGRDAALRRLTERFAHAALGAEPADPVGTWLRLHQTVADTGAAVEDVPAPEPIPRLAALLCLGAVDNALHDAWARAAGRPAHTMYTPDHLAHDLGACVDPTLAGRYPGEFLTAPRRRLPVQHVVGTADPLRPGDAGGARSLEEWLRRDGVRHVKIKVPGRDPDADARRIAEVHRVASARTADVVLSVDPNEGYPGPAALGAMLDALAATAPDAFQAVAFVEQPWPRDSSPDPAAVREQSRRRPVLMDESLHDPAQLRHVRSDGWSGVVVKAGKGQTPALLTYAFARAHGLFVTMQDLTAVDAALAHSARLASVFDLSAPHLEYNSRQYAPTGNRDLAGRQPSLVTVDDGVIVLDEPTAGIY
ncbi:enolase C-terminal domain-like protein [Micromonospora sp. NPDC047620]|uniref:enolase C-terminal domain-like protein n=1 Tax=Micromonospora sp. NPDC047620 TaxID=3364251 RepID=UPI00371A1EC8